MRHLEKRKIEKRKKEYVIITGYFALIGSKNF